MIKYEADCLGTASNVLHDQTCSVSLQVLRDTYNLAQDALVAV